MSSPQSQQRQQPSDGSSIDPVLARYHAIKRQMEENGGSIYSSANQPPQQARSVTPRRSAVGTVSAQPGNTRYGTPAPGPAAPAPPPSLSLYTAVLTPDGKQQQQHSHHPTPRTAVGPDLNRSFNTHSTPAVPALRGAGAPKSPNTSHYAGTGGRENTNMGTVNSVIESELVDQERRRVRELDEARRALQSERDRMRERINELEERLRLEGSATSEAQHHVNALRSEQQRGSHLVETLQADLVARTTEVTSLRERQIQLERRLLDAESELQLGGGGTNHRVLAGKVTALEELVKSKQTEIEDEQRRQKIAELRLEEAEQNLAQMRGTLEAKDRELGEASVQLRETQRAKERAETVVREGHDVERDLEQKVDDLREQIRAAGESADAELRQHKEELRGKSREAQRLEVQLAASQEELKEVAALKVNLEKEVELLRQQGANSARDAKAWQSRQEAVQVLQAAETAAKEDAQRECTRLREEGTVLRDELRAHAKQCEQYEELLREADREREVREALDAQVRVLQASFARQEEDSNALRLQHESLQRRCQEMEEQAAKVVPLERKVAEAEAHAELRLEQLEKGKQRESTLQAEYDTLCEQVRTAKMEGEEAKRDFVLSHERCLSLQQEIVELEDQLGLLGEAQDRMSQLNDAYEKRTQEVGHMTMELQSWQLRFKEADAEATNLRSLIVKLQSAEDRLGAAQEQCHQKEDTIRAMERKVAALETQGRDYEEQKYAAANQVANLEQEVQRQNGMLADRQQLESRLQQTINELGGRTEEMSKERNKVLDLQTRMREREEHLAQERSKRADAENHAHHLQSELTKVQVDLGRVTVQLESCDKERQRIEHFVQQRAAAYEEKSMMVERLERSLQEKDEELRAKAITDTNVRHEIELSELRAKELGSQLAQAKRTVEEQRDVVRRTEEERRNLAQKAEMLHRVEEKLMGVEASLQARDEDLSSANRTNAQLKQRVKELQAETTTLRQAEQRVGELKALLDRHGMHLEQAEKEDASKSQKIIEKEREAGRIRERLAAVQGELDSERQRRQQAEATARELEAASARAVQMEGQVAGLTQVLSQRTRDLEESRHLVNELRDRVRKDGGGDSSSSSSSAKSGSKSIGSNLSAAELDAKLRAKDETIARLEQEEQRRHTLVDSLRRELAAAEQDKATAQRELHDLQTKMDRNEVSWRARCTRLEQELSDGKRIAVDGRTRRLEEELLDVKCKNSTLSSEVERLKRELTTALAAEDQMNNSSTSGRNYGAAASNRLQLEIQRSRASLEGIHGGDESQQRARADSPYTSPEPKKRSVRSVLGSSNGGAGAPRSFISNNNGGGGGGATSPGLNL